MQREIYGWTKLDAIKELRCIKCRELAPPRCRTKAGVAEYMISGLCEVCFDDLTKE